MATTLTNVTDLLGRHVYMPYRAHLPGKIVRDLGLQTRIGPLGNSVQAHWVQVRFINGSLQDCTVRSLNDYTALIEDHRRKLATHEANQAKLDAMPSEPF